VITFNTLHLTLAITNVKQGPHARITGCSFQLKRNYENKYPDIFLRAFMCLIKHHAIKTYWRSGDTVPRMLNLGTMWRWVVNFTLRPLYLRGKSPRYPLQRRLCGSQSRSVHSGGEKNPCPYRELKPGRLARSLVTILTELSRFPRRIILKPILKMVWNMAWLNWLRIGSSKHGNVRWDFVKAWGGGVLD
jgi:hypothetical protein